MSVNYLPYKPLGIFQGQAEIAMSVNVFSTQSGTSQIAISVKERKKIFHVNKPLIKHFTGTGKNGYISKSIFHINH